MSCGRCGSSNVKVLHPRQLWHLAGCTDCGYMKNSTISDEDALDKLSRYEDFDNMEQPHDTRP